MIMYMYKLAIYESGNNTRYAMFQEQQDALDFQTVLESKGIETVLNKWTWKTEVEN